MNGYLDPEGKSFLCEQISTKRSLWDPEHPENRNKGSKRKCYLEILNALSDRFGQRFKGIF